MRARISLLLSASLLLGATAATAQSFPCGSVAPEVRERVREAGACRDTTPSDAAPMPNDAAPKDAEASNVTMSLSDGSVVRVPREISTIISDERKRAEANKPVAPVSAQSEPDTSGDPAPATQKLKVPDVVGRSYDEAGRELAEFRVNRIETASAAPRGEVLEQEPVPSTLMLPGGRGQPAGVGRLIGKRCGQELVSAGTCNGLQGCTGGGPRSGLRAARSG